VWCKKSSSDSGSGGGQWMRLGWSLSGRATGNPAVTANDVHDREVGRIGDWGRCGQVADWWAQAAQARILFSGLDQAGRSGPLRNKVLYFLKHFLINAEINRKLGKILTDLRKI
jgi:hypothetical protein